MNAFQFVQQSLYLFPRQYYRQSFGAFWIIHVNPDFGAAHLLGLPHVVEDNKTADPIDVRFFRSHTTPKICWRRAFFIPYRGWRSDKWILWYTETMYIGYSGIMQYWNIQKKRFCKRMRLRSRPPRSRTKYFVDGDMCLNVKFNLHLAGDCGSRYKAGVVYRILQNLVYLISPDSV